MYVCMYYTHAHTHTHTQTNTHTHTQVANKTCTIPCLLSQSVYLLD
jgi:hypothetical protein